jgi:hypothetical protein
VRRVICGKKTFTLVESDSFGPVSQPCPPVHKNSYLSRQERDQGQPMVAGDKNSPKRTSATPRTASIVGTAEQSSCWGGKTYVPAPFREAGVTRSAANVRTASIATQPGWFGVPFRMNPHPEPLMSLGKRTPPATDGLRSLTLSTSRWSPRRPPHSTLPVWCFPPGGGGPGIHRSSCAVRRCPSRG